MPLVLDDPSQALLVQFAIHAGPTGPQLAAALRVAATIASLADKERIEPSHLAEALQYRWRE